jgi:hypothetical protein
MGGWVGDVPKRVGVCQGAVKHKSKSPQKGNIQIENCRTHVYSVPVLYAVGLCGRDLIYAEAYS